MEERLYDKLLERIKKYRRAIDGVGFAEVEQNQIGKEPESEEELLSAIDAICNSSIELNRILEECPNSMFIVDEKGTCLRVNKAYESMVKMKRSDVVGENVAKLDANGTFRPSVCLLVLKEGRKVSIMQDVREEEGIAVTGVPVFNEEKKLFRVVTNAVKVDEVKSLTSYIAGKEDEQSEVNSQKRDQMIAESDEMKAILQLADVIKDTESSVLITGETGVGKGVLAEYIHKTSNRKAHRMVNINCGAIPETLLESELFGYESGAFTGADKKGKPGLIEAGDGGTLFLDEISELPLIMQVKILHFLQKKTITRVGGTREIPVNTRIIAASNKSLEEEVVKGNFRSDLYYRLNVIPIHIPPLRERTGDIRPVVEYFLDFYMKKYHKHMSISKELMDEILKAPWYGNVRELENYIERVVVTNASNYLLKANRNSKTDDDKPQSLEQAVDEVERDLMIKAYGKYGSSYKVAKALGMSQATAYRKLRKYVDLSRK